MIDPVHLRLEVIRPVLRHIGLFSLAAENLLLGTAAQETHLGRYLVQLGGGPALGIYQMEPATHRDILDNYLRYRAELDNRIARLVAPWPTRREQLVTNLAYATAMARIHYLRVPEALPAHDDVEGLAKYYLLYYNTIHGKATKEEFIANWHKLVRGVN